ncbi:MAG: PIN domain-containing protein [Desulfurellaceae bacterium]|nr:PIN domain-containing protein [Desulfurellaceae bacterium]
MRQMFVDTAAWVAAADSRDTAGSAVREARDQWLLSGGVLTTTDYVIDETLTTIRFRLGLDAAEAWWLQINGSTRLRIESINEPRRERARTLFFRYRDKNFSFTDCCSFAVMRELCIRRALTLDHHFRQIRCEVVP